MQIKPREGKTTEWGVGGGDFEKDDQMAGISVGGVIPLSFASPEWLFNAPQQKPDVG